MRKIAAVAHKRPVKGFEEKQEDLQYWLSRSPQERVAAVTMLIKQTLKPGQTMDRTFASRRKMHS